MTQLEHLRQYRGVARRLKEGRLALHGLWFDLKALNVQYMDLNAAIWHELDEKTVDLLLKRLPR